MTSINSYMEQKELRYKVTVGRKTVKGFRTALDALRHGVQMAADEDGRAYALCKDKSFERQVGIIFGADVKVKYLGNQTSAPVPDAQP